MVPALPEGALVAVTPFRGAAGSGAVVVVRRPDGTEHLKRIVALPGEEFTLGDGRRLVLAADEYAVAGDHRAVSTDSRHYGPVNVMDVVAVARFCYWPPRAWRWLSRGR
jgi:type IV secretory pathway protease TraF